ncbi:MAG: protein kinase [Pseudomonadota bacterium]
MAGQLAPGEVLNFTYEIVAQIGEGGTGEVYRARNRSTGRDVAIKLLKAEYAQDPTVLKIMKREADALHDVRNQAIVHYADMMDTEIRGQKLSFLVMEFVEGMTLASRIDQGPMSPAEVEAVAKRVLTGLAAAHAKAVLHRDLTPGNVILRSNDAAQATLIDFGIAKDMGKQETTTTLNMMTLAYASPEQVDNLPMDPRSDLYSMGVTLLSALRGKRASQDKTVKQLLEQKEQPPELYGVPEPLFSLLHAVMQPEPKARPAGAVEALKLLGVETGTMEETVEKTGPTQPDPPRRRWVAVLAGLCFLGAAGIGGYAAFGPDPAPPLAEPYVFRFSVDGAGPRLTGHAPSAEAAAAAQRQLASAFPSDPIQGGLNAASGMPSETWLDAMVQLGTLAAPLEDLRLEMAGVEGRLEGTAGDVGERAAIRQAARQLASAENLTLTLDLDVAGTPLPHALLAEAVAPHSSCGPIDFLGADPLAPGETVQAIGRVASKLHAEEMTAALEAVDTTRSVRVDVVVDDNAVSCLDAVMGRLHPLSNRVRMVMSYGQKPGTASDGTYYTGENPVIDVLVDQRHADDLIYVLSVSPSGEAALMLPNRNRQENRVRAAANGTAGSWYQVRVTHPLPPELDRAAIPAGQPVCASDQICIEVKDGDYGVVILAVVLSTSPLFADSGDLVTWQNAPNFLADLAKAFHELGEENYIPITRQVVTAERDTD